MSRIRTAAVALAATGLVLAGGAATAATKSAKDKSGDAAQVADITRVTVDNGDDVLSIKVKLAKAKAGRTDLVATLTTPTEGGTTYVARTVVLPAKGNSHAKKIGATLETVAGEGTEPTPVECDGIKATLSSGRQGQSSIRIPQACFGDDAGTLLVDVATATPAGEIADEVPVTLRVKQG
jgi:hypothetical protein